MNRDNDNGELILLIVLVLAVLTAYLI